MSEHSSRIQTLSATLIIAAAACSTRAAQTLEFNFHEPADGTTVTASASAPGVLDTATLIGDGVIDTGDALGQGFKDDVATGYYSNGDRIDDRLTTAATYDQLFNSNGDNFGSGAVVIVIRPSGEGWGTQRNWLFVHGAAVSSTSSLTAAVGSQGVGLNGGRTANNENGFSLVLPHPEGGWQTDTWYFIGLSWQQSTGPETEDKDNDGRIDGLEDGRLRIYRRTLKVGDTLTPEAEADFAFSDTAVIWNTRPGEHFLKGTLNLANRDSAGPDEGAMGDIALYRFYDSLFESADFDAEYRSLLPEPTSGAVLGAAAMFGLRRRTRHRWQTR